MANSTTVSNCLFDSLFPTIGSPRIDAPIWDDGRSMFIVNEYVKRESGNRYYTGVRQADRFVIYIYVGKCKNWDYLDKLEVYVYDGNRLCLIGCKEFDKTFYNEEVIDAVTREIMMGYARAEAALMNVPFCVEQLQAQIDDTIRRSRKSILDESSYALLRNTVRLLPSDSRRDR